MITRQEIFLCDMCVRPPSRPFSLPTRPVGSICGPLTELGRRSCGAGVPGWLNATVPFRVLVRNAMFRRVELAGRRDRATLGELDRDAGWDADAWVDAMAPYWDEHPTLLTDARGPRPGTAHDR